MLRNSDTVIIFMVTLGPGLERMVERMMEKNEPTRGFILDAIGSETADQAADLMHHHILKDLAGKQGRSITPRYSPGYGDWPVTVQPDLCELCSGEKIGIRITEFCMMIPRKSVSAVLGFKLKDEKGTG
jgi:cobalamin-dependent methionine synthase I